MKNGSFSNDIKNWQIISSERFAYILNINIGIVSPKFVKTLSFKH